MTRKRSRTDFGPFEVRYLHGGTPTYYFDWNTFTYYEYMEDVSRPIDRIKPESWVNAIDHTKWRYFGDKYHPWSGDYGISVVPINVPPLLDSELLQSMLPVLSEGDRNDLLMEAFNAFTEVWPEEMSVAESLQGLKDMKSMIPKFSGDIVSDLAGLYLNKSFAWDSLVSDLKAFSGLVDSVERRLDWFRKTYGKPTPLRFKRLNILQANLGAEIVVEPVRSWGTKYILRGYRLDFRANATLHQRMGHLDDSIGYLRGLVGALGGANPLKQVWNLIPLSFVVDYFFNVSNRLDALSRVRPEEQWELSRVTHSFKETAVWDIWQTNQNLLAGPANPDQPLGTLVLTKYDRGLGLPFTVLSLDLQTLNPAQQGLLAALMAGIKYR